MASAAMKVERKLQRNRNTTIDARIEPTNKMFFDRVQRVLDKYRVIADDPHLKTLWKRGLDVFQPRFYFMGYRDRILAGLFRDDKRDRGLAVEPGFRAYLLRTVLRISEVFDLNLIVAACCDDNIVELLRLLDLADRADTCLSLPLVETAARKFNVLDPKCVRNFRCRYVVGTHLVRIDPDIYLPFAAADDGDLADTVDRLDPFLDSVFGDLCYIA